MRTLFLVVVLSTLAWPQTTKEPYKVQPTPKLPIFDWNACPFEGCAYRKWTAEAAVDVFDTWKPNRTRIATLPAKAVVTGISGVVITYKPGVIRVDRDLPQDDLRRGDTIFTYSYLGEGFSVVWFKGRLYREYDITFAKWLDEKVDTLGYVRGSGCQGTDCAGTYVDLGEKVWWAKVKMTSGVVGWVNMGEAQFSGVDQLV